MSSCFLTTVSDDLDDIFQGIKHNALLAKYSGGLGNDWTPVRGIGAHIKGTNGLSSGVVPFLKIANDTAVAVNQGGKRKGAVCAYLESWHVDIEEFLDLRKNTGDDRRRTHDMNTANWIPDEFLRRVEADGQWTLFSPDEVPDLHDLVGNDFAERYAEYEAAADRGELRVFRRVRAVELWRKMLTSLFETGHPWITFKDPCNLRSPQQHVGVVHSSNLCTEITLNTGPAPRPRPPCATWARSICRPTSDPMGWTSSGCGARSRPPCGCSTTSSTSTSTRCRRPAGRTSRTGRSGWGSWDLPTALYTLGVPYASDAAVEFADTSMEQLSLLRHRGVVRPGRRARPLRLATRDRCGAGASCRSTRSRSWPPHRGGDLEQDRTQRLDWNALRQQGACGRACATPMCMAIAPTATISNIIGVSQSIEPTYRNLFVKANMSGDFTVVNEYLVRELKRRDLWDEVMIADLKYFDGSLGPSSGFRTRSRNCSPPPSRSTVRGWYEAASRRQKWIDQAQSLNLYVAAPERPQARPAVPAGLAPGLQDHVLPAVDVRHPRGEIHAARDRRPAECGVPGRDACPEQPDRTLSCRPVPAVGPSEPLPLLGGPSSDALACSIDNPDCEACQ